MVFLLEKQSGSNNSATRTGSGGGGVEEGYEEGGYGGDLDALQQKVQGAK